MLILRKVALLAVALIAAAASRGSAQPRAGGARAADSVGVILVAHGADITWNSRIDSLAAALRRRGAIGPVGVAFLMGDEAPKHRFQDVVAELTRAGARRVVVVPILVSSHSGHYEQIRYLAGQTDSLDEEMMHHLHMSGIARPETKVPITVTRAMDSAPELAEVLADRAKRIAPAGAGRALFLLGHGPNSAEEYAAWMHELRPVADSIKARGGFASVLVELVRDDAPAEVRAEAVLRSRELIQLQRDATKQDVIVVPILVSGGSMVSTTVPADLAGLPIMYRAEPLLMHDALARWVERMVREAGKGS